MAKGQKTGGRTKGTLNKATAEIKALAQLHAEAAMTELARLATSAESEAARVAAIKELFDRGYGKATQSVEMDASLTAKVQMIERRIVRPSDSNR
jgi:cob(I)alamin adenosyltransferase